MTGQDMQAPEFDLDLQAPYGEPVRVAENLARNHGQQSPVRLPPRTNTYIVGRSSGRDNRPRPEDEAHFQR